MNLLPVIQALFCKAPADFWTQTQSFATVTRTSIYRQRFISCAQTNALGVHASFPILPRYHADASVADLKQQQIQVTLDHLEEDRFDNLDVVAAVHKDGAHYRLEELVDEAALLLGEL